MILRAKRSSAAPTAQSRSNRGENADVSRREVCLAMELRCGGDRPAPMIPGMVLGPEQFTEVVKERITELEQL